LIDVNLPFDFGVWRRPDFLWQNEVEMDEWDDEKIWKFAQQNNLTIVTKDADFHDKIILRTPPPRVIWVRTGNMKLEFFINLLKKTGCLLKK
jgi:predicted nuclease of predicted toxin-antitoxin system